MPQVTPSPGGSRGLLSRLFSVGRLPAPATGAMLAVLACFHLFVGTRLTAVIEGVRYFGLTDDPMISLRYARNLANGQGLLWNPGEPPVEGITNLLWTLWMSLGHLLLPDEKVALWVVATSAVCLAVLAVLTARLAARFAPDSLFVPATALVMTGLYYPLVHASMLGWETGAMALLATWMTVMAMDATDGAGGADAIRWRFAAAAVVAVLMRLDAVVVVGALGAWVLATTPDRRARVRFVRDVGGAVVVVLLVMTAWRHSYYGAWLPNTFTMKVGGLPLSQRLARGVATQWQTLATHLWVLVPFVGVALWARPGARASRWVALWVAVVQLAYILWVGGDAWEDPGRGNRWLWMVMPGLLALSAVGMRRVASYLAPQPYARGLGAVTAAAIITFFGFRTAPEFLTFDFSQGTYFWRVHVGLHVAKYAPAATVADWWGGVVPYFSRLPAVDLLGKSDAHVARMQPHNADVGHHKWDYGYSIGVLRPDVVVELYNPVDEDWALLDSLGYAQGPLGVWYAPGVVVPEPDEAEYPRRR